MQTYFIHFTPAAGVLVAAMLCGAPSFAQTGGASNVIPNAGSKQDPDVTKPAAVNTTKAERQAASAKRKAEVTAAGGASNAIPNAGAKQDPQVDKPAAVTKATKEEKLAARQTQSRYCCGRISEQSEKSAQQPVGQRRHQCGNFCNASLQELMGDRFF
ncbi:hypothetical protein LP417_14195 [Polaromonas sp. P1-6]|nr:hypothetical protein LP417_14195 [Polaromonas sp. P1-6]